MSFSVFVFAFARAVLIGRLPREEVWASLRRFAEKVMPKFR